MLESTMRNFYCGDLYFRLLSVCSGISINGGFLNNLPINHLNLFLSFQVKTVSKGNNKMGESTKFNLKLKIDRKSRKQNCVFCVKIRRERKYDVIEGNNVLDQFTFS